MLKVLVLGRIHQSGIDRLREAKRFSIVERPDNPDDLLTEVEDAYAVIVRTTRINRQVISKAPGLKLVARHGVGYDAVDVDALTARKIPLALTGDVNSGAVAEHTLALMLSLAKRITAYDKAVREGDFRIRDTFSAYELAGRTLLIIGFGRIGRRVNDLAQAFGMTVLVADPFVSTDDIKASGATPVALHEALPVSDFVSIHAPKTPDGITLGREEIGKIKRGAAIVNVARGGMVDETALVDALNAGHISGAGLDVFEDEPLPATSPVASHKNIVLSPHSAAFTGECVQRMADACARNVIAFEEGKLDPTLVVNRQVLTAGRGAL